MEKYERIPHTADIAVKVYGCDLKDLFANAAFGMFDIIADLDGISAGIAVKVDLKAQSPEELLVAWLDELLYDFYTKNIIFSKFDVREIAQNGPEISLSAEVHGRHVGENKNRLKTEIKAVTFHNLAIKEGEGGYSVEIVFDV